jgi:hypothetical protein
MSAKHGGKLQNAPNYSYIFHFPAHQGKISYENPLPAIALRDFFVKDRKFYLKNPLTFYPKWNDEHDYLLIEDNDYELLVYAKDRQSLESELKEEFALMWNVYAMSEDEQLTPRAKKLKYRLRETVSDGTE